MKVLLLSTALLASPLQAQPAIGAIVNSASYQPTLAPGCWATLFGAGLAPGEATAAAVPLPKTLGGVSVSVNGIPAPLRYVSPGQINFVVPFEIAVKSVSVVPVKVTSTLGTSATYNLRLAAQAPALFTRDGNPAGAAHAFDESFRSLASVDGGSNVILYAAGLGPTTPAAQSDSGGSAVEPLNRVANAVDVYVGDAPAKVLFAGLAPGFPGVYQLNVATGAPLSSRVYLRSGGWQSNVAEMGLATGSNVSNVSGTIDGLYPLTRFDQPPLYMPQWKTVAFSSAMLTAGIYSVAFDLKPDAKPFYVVATSEAARASILFDPAAGTYTATITVPTEPPRFGDFSLTEFQPLWDFMSCPDVGCFPFPNSMIPLNRVDPVWAAVIRLLPVPNEPSTSRASMGTFSVRGSAPAGSRFVIDSDHHPELSMFGGFFQISPGLPKVRTAPFRVYVDGKLVASRDAAYEVLQ